MICKYIYKFYITILYNFLGIDDFAIIGIHTSPKTAEIEVNALVDVYEDVAKTMKIKVGGS